MSTNDEEFLRALADEIEFLMILLQDINNRWQNVHKNKEFGAHTTEMVSFGLNVEIIVACECLLFLSFELCHNWLQINGGLAS